MFGEPDFTEEARKILDKYGGDIEQLLYEYDITQEWLIKHLLEEGIISSDDEQE